MSGTSRLDFDLLTKNEVAKMLGVTARTVHSYVKQGIGPAVTRVGGSVRFRTDALEDWLASRTLPPGERPAEARVE